MKKFIILIAIMIILISTDKIYGAFGNEGAFGSVVNYLKRAATSIIPSKDDTYDLGTAVKKWKTLYVNTISDVTVGDFVMSDANPWAGWRDTDTDTGYILHWESGDTYPYGLFPVTWSSSTPSISGNGYPIWYVNSSNNFIFPDPDVDVSIAGNLTVTGTVTGINALLLDQTTPQEIINGFPQYEDGHAAFTEQHSLVDKEYVDSAVVQLGGQFFMLDAADGTVAAYKQNSLTASALGTASVAASANAAADTLIEEWISPSTYTWTTLQAGIYDLTVFAARTAGSRAVRVFWRFYERKSDTSEVLITTSNMSELVTTKAQFNIYCALSEDYTPSVDSRLVGKVYFNTSATPSTNTTCTLYYQGDEDSNWLIPLSQEFLDDNYVEVAGDTMTGNLTMPDGGTVGAATNKWLFDDTGGDISCTGNVGIGTTGPGAKLDVSGNVIVGITSNSLSKISLRTAGGAIGNYSGISFSGWSNQQKSAVGHIRTAGYGVGDLVFFVDSNIDGSDVSTADEKVRITSSGYIGIGTTSPGSKLSVNGGISAGTYYGTAAPSNGMIISGNVGIGTTTPAEELHLVGDFIMQDGNPWISWEDTDTNTGYILHWESGDTYPFALYPTTYSSGAPSVAGAGYPIWYVDSSQNFRIPDPTRTMTIGGALTLSGTFNAKGTIVNFSPTTDEYVLGYDTTTNTWRGVAATAGAGDLKADGTVPLTADWNAGNSLYDITAVEFKGALKGTADAVTNATLTTALTVNTGAVTLTGDAGASTLTLGAGASSVSGANTGDNTVATTGDAALDFFGAGVTAVTDATACTDLEGTGLSITGGTLNASGTGDVTGPGASVDNEIVRFNSTTGKIIQAYTSGGPVITDTGIVTMSGNSGARAYLNITQDNLPTAVSKPVLNAESYDIQGEFDSAVKTSTADATEASKLHDADGGFEAGDVGRTVFNQTDGTYALVSAYVDAGELTLSADIMASGETYYIHISRFTATVAGYYATSGQAYYKAGTEDGKALSMRIYKNGAEVLDSLTTCSAAALTVSTSALDVIVLAIGDYLELFTHPGSAANTADLQIGSAYTFLSVNKMR